MLHISNIIWYLSFSVGFTSFSMIISRSIHVAANVIISFFFNGWVIFHCIYVPHLLCPFICWWTFRLLVHCSAVYNSQEMEATPLCLSVHCLYHIFLHTVPENGNSKNQDILVCNLTTVTKFNKLTLITFFQLSFIIQFGQLPQ